MLILNYLFRDIILYTDLSRIFLILPLFKKYLTIFTYKIQLLDSKNKVQMEIFAYHLISILFRSSKIIP